MFELMIKGGIFMIPIGLCSILAIAFTIERFVYLWMHRTPLDEFWESIDDDLENHDWDMVRQKAEEYQGHIPQLVSVGLQVDRLKPERVREAMEDFGSEIVPQLEQFLPTLDFIARVSPLLGLLGTVAGMIRTFTAIAQGGIGNPDLLAGGISQALVTTAAGLTVGIITLFFHHLLSRQVDTTLNDMKHAARRVESHLKDSEGAVQ